MSKKEKWLNKYEKIEELGEGGNAKVYRVKATVNNNEFALKELMRGGEEKRGRFIDEIKIIKENYAKIVGILPIYDYSEDELWYTMPIAQPALNYIIINNLKIISIVEYVIQLCETLEQLHAKGIAHRDIKPSNIYFYNNRFYLGDFGLVEFPERSDFTRSDKGLGAILECYHISRVDRHPKI